jgi:hypothetical protein
MWLRGAERPVDAITANGHTAFEAFMAARPRLGEMAFCELEFDLVAERAPGLAPVAPSEAMVRRVRRRLRAQGVPA